MSTAVVSSSSAAAPIPVVVVGVGHLGKIHARIYAELPEARLVGVVDTDAASARAVGEKFNVRHATSVEPFLAEASAFSVVVPTKYHHVVTRPLLEAGKHVLLEKPMALNLEQARELHALSGARNAIMQIGHVERFNPAVLGARALVKDPRFMEVHRLGPFPERATDVGVTLDLMIHDIDLCLSLVGKPVVDVRATGAKLLTAYEDIANARLEFEGGCVANLTASRLTLSRMRKLRLFQPDAYISMDCLKQSYAVFEKKVPEPKSLKDIQMKRPRVKKGEPLKEELRHFLGCVAAGRAPTVGAKEGADALAVALRIVEQIQRGGNFV